VARGGAAAAASRGGAVTGGDRRRSGGPTGGDCRLAFWEDGRQKPRSAAGAAFIWSSAQSMPTERIRQWFEQHTATGWCRRNRPDDVPACIEAFMLSSRRPGESPHTRRNTRNAR
jgi:hypothetical protein